jgi:hypothetical protein
MHIILEIPEFLNSKFNALHDPQQFLQQLLIPSLEFGSNQTNISNQEIETLCNTSLKPMEKTNVLDMMKAHGILGCMEGEGDLSVNYKAHLWGKE